MTKPPMSYMEEAKYWNEEMKRLGTEIDIGDKDRGKWLHCFQQKIKFLSLAANSK